MEWHCHGDTRCIYASINSENTWNESIRGNYEVTSQCLNYVTPQIIFVTTAKNLLVHGSYLLPPLSFMHCVFIWYLFANMCGLTVERTLCTLPVLDRNTKAHTQPWPQPPNCPDPSSIVLSWVVTESWTEQRHHTGSKASIASSLVPGSADTLRCPDRSELFRWHKEIKWSSQQVGVSVISVYFRPKMEAFFFLTFKSKWIHIFCVGWEYNLNLMHLCMKDKADERLTVLSW